MTVQLNIKDPKTTALVTELAQITGRSKTEAIRLAVEAALARENARKDEGLERKLAEIAAIVERARALVRPGDILTDDDMYDECGLPK
jgi:antitoxin VapB